MRTQNLKTVLWLKSVFLFIISSIFLLGCQQYPMIPDEAGTNDLKRPVKNAGLFRKDLSQTQGEKEYKIGKNDVISVEVIGHEELSGTQEVDTNGQILLPLIGKVSANGLTTNQLAKGIENRLRAGYLVDPKVKVTVKEFKSQKVFIMGEVNSPGMYYLKGPKTLLEILLEAGGLSTQSSPIVKLIRPKDPNKKSGPTDISEATPDEVINIDIRSIQKGDSNQNIYLKNGDTIIVQKAAPLYFYVLGEVKKPGQFEYYEGITVLQAITIAGGVTKKGSPKRVKIIRIQDGRKRQIRARLIDAIQPKDIVFIPQRFF